MALEYLTWWLSPGVACFLFLNVLVAAIAVTSRSRAAQHGGRAATTTTTTRRLCRSASSMVLDRLRSFSFSTMFSTHPSVELCYDYYVSPEAEELKQVSGAAAAPDRQLAVPEPAAATAAISTSENAEDEITAGVVKKSMGSDGNGTQESMPSSPPPPPPAAPAVAVVTAETAPRVALARGPPKEEPATTVAEFVKPRHHAPVYALEGKAELNARAEQFIRQFRQELQLQRLDSMLSRHTHTLSTGSGAPTSR